MINNGTLSKLSMLGYDIIGNNNWAYIIVDPNGLYSFYNIKNNILHKNGHYRCSIIGEFVITEDVTVEGAKIVSGIYTEIGDKNLTSKLARFTTYNLIFPNNRDSARVLCIKHLRMKYVYMINNKGKLIKIGTKEILCSEFQMSNLRIRDEENRIIISSVYNSCDFSGHHHSKDVAIFDEDLNKIRIIGGLL